MTSFSTKYHYLFVSSFIPNGTDLKTAKTVPSNRWDDPLFALTSVGSLHTRGLADGIREILRPSAIFFGVSMQSISASSYISHREEHEVISVYIGLALNSHKKPAFLRVLLLAFTASTTSSNHSDAIMLTNPASTQEQGVFTCLKYECWKFPTTTGNSSWSKSTLRSTFGST